MITTKVSIKQYLAVRSNWNFLDVSVYFMQKPLCHRRKIRRSTISCVHILDGFYSLLPQFLHVWNSVLDTNSSVSSACIFGQAFEVIWLFIPFVGTHIALWGYQFYFPFSPNKSNLLVFILSPAIQYELFTLCFPEIVEAIGMFIAKNMQGIRLKQDALILGYLLGYLLDCQFSPKATLDTLFTLARFFSFWIYPWVHATVFPRVLLHFCVTR